MPDRPDLTAPSPSGHGRLPVNTRSAAQCRSMLGGAAGGRGSATAVLVGSGGRPCDTPGWRGEVTGRRLWGTIPPAAGTNDEVLALHRQHPFHPHPQESDTAHGD